MKKVILIVVGVVIVIFIGVVFFDYLFEKKEIEEITPRFEKQYKEALIVYEGDKEKGNHWAVKCIG
ncbi:MAG: hypothetical protein E3J47_03305 [Candidatus Stahlbacteria bacterium]|nr:MAG: hypothetical protein E3J47_03305 [Candidatus Stahlbacteria bacterium]